MGRTIFQAVMLVISGGGIIWSYSGSTSMHSAAFWVSLILFIGYLLFQKTDS